MIRISPSDPIASMTKGKKISEETRQSLTEEYYLDKSYPEQYVIWIKNIFKGDLGKSFQYRQSVNSLLGQIVYRQHFRFGTYEAPLLR